MQSSLQLHLYFRYSGGQASSAGIWDAEFTARVSESFYLHVQSLHQLAVLKPSLRGYGYVAGGYSGVATNPVYGRQPRDSGA